MTGLHGLHVIAGLSLIGVMLVFTVRGRISGNDYVRLENAGLYWHLVDLIWIYLFPLFYLIT
jgi:cytochrome c oxidase subunit 3